MFELMVEQREKQQSNKQMPLNATRLVNALFRELHIEAQCINSKQNHSMEIIKQ